MGIQAGGIMGGLDVETEGVAQLGSEPEVETIERPEEGVGVGRGSAGGEGGGGGGGEGKVLGGADGFEVMVAMIGHVFKPLVVTSVIVSGGAESSCLTRLGSQGDGELESRQQIETGPRTADHKGDRELVEEELVCTVGEQTAIRDRHSASVDHILVKPLTINRLNWTLERIIESHVEQQMAVLVLVCHAYLASAGEAGLRLRQVVKRLHQAAAESRSHIVLSRERMKMKDERKEAQHPKGYMSERGSHCTISL